MAEPYSERNPVPTIERYEKDVETRKQQEEPASPTSPTSHITDHDDHSALSHDDFSNIEHSDAREEPQTTTSNDTNLSGDEQPKTAEEEKKVMMEKMQGPKPKPIEKGKRRRGERVVKDPTTGLDVVIKDADFKDYPKGATLDPDSGVPGPALTAPSTSTKGSVRKGIPGPHKIFHPKHTAPNPAHPSNVSLQPFPPSAPVALDPLLALFDYLQLALAAAFTAIWFLLAWDDGLWKFTWASTLIGGCGFGLVTVASLISRKLEKEVERIRLDMHRQRGEKFAPPTPESVEWLNAFLKTVWGIVNPDMFVPIADMVEDIMQQSLPGFIDAVRISDIGQGTNPVRVLSMRALPDQPGDREYPREEWIDQGTNELMTQAEKDRAAGKDVDQSGDYVNYEVAISYQALPGQGDELRAKNIHLLIQFFIGMFDWLRVPIPIWIQVEGFVATVRLRIQFITEPPFVRNLTFTFMGVPAVEVSAIPLVSKLPNVMDLPLISRFVKMAIAAGTAEFTAPKSMTLNIQEILASAVIGDTRALGVFLITIHHALDLSAQDRNGLSDPYIVLAYAKFGKPLYSTRIILGDLNPVWEETTALLVTADEVKAEENLSVMLWDSDKRTADDLIGRIKIPVKELMATPNKMLRRTDKLRGFEDADTMPGTLHWSIGYFDKVPLNRELERPSENPPPVPSKTAPQMEMRPGDKGPNPAAHDLPPPKPDVSRTPPDPRYPSGVLSVVVHQINNLERQNLRGTSGKDREGQAGQDTDEPSEEGSNLPCAYCELIVNDDLVYKTRVKQYTSMPFFEAGTEAFIRDWQNTVVRVVVRDSRVREKDPILGIVNLHLKDLLKESSEVTRLFAIEEGIGFGRVNLSLLFRSVDVKLPRNLLGWDTGTVEVLAPIKFEAAPGQTFKPQAKKLVVSTTDSTEYLSADATENGDVSWAVEKLRLPVYSRYNSSLTIQIGKGNKPDALAMLWLKDIPDDEELDMRIPLVVGKSLKQLRQNVLNEETAKTHEYQIVGYMVTKLKLDSGLDEDHEAHAISQARRHAFETFDHVEGQALVAERNAHAADDGVIDKDEKKALDHAHSRQLRNRQRGLYGYRPYRTAVWMKEGIKSRILPKKKPPKREPTVRTEA